MGLLWSALVLGLAGSMHCAAMCGPIILGFGRTDAKSSFLYHGGRIGAYVLLGLFFGMAGKALHLIVYQQSISIISGVLIFVMLMARMFPSYFKNANFIYHVWQKIRTLFLPYIKTMPKFITTVLMGTLNGFLPCGLVYIAASASMSMGNISGSLVYMILFGIGTLPMLLGIGYLAKIISIKNRLFINKLMPGMVLLLSLLFVVRGLALNIPYLSPKISNDGKKIESCCKNKINKN